MMSYSDLTTIGLKYGLLIHTKMIPPIKVIIIPNNPLTKLVMLDAANNKPITTTVKLKKAIIILNPLFSKTNYKPHFFII